jgi:hypothetical protein
MLVRRTATGSSTSVICSRTNLYLSIYGILSMVFSDIRLLATALNFKRTGRKLISIYLPSVLESRKWELEKEREENIVTLR